MTPQGEVPVAPPGWFARNWKWAVPVGCGLPMLCCLSFAAMTVMGVGAALKGTEPYVEGLKRATTNAEVKAALGEPVTAGMMMSGSINEKGSGRGEADISVPLTGPKGKGTLHVSAEKNAGAWSYQTMEVELDGAGRINLLGGASRPPVPSREPDSEFKTGPD